jgi:hypothetical protein
MCGCDRYRSPSVIDGGLEKSVKGTGFLTKSENFPAKIGYLFMYSRCLLVKHTIKYRAMKRKDRSSSTQDDRKRNDELNKSEQKDKKLPGEYPPQEDIMNRRDTERVGLDVDNFSRNVGVENFNKQNEPVTTEPDDILREPSLENIDDPEKSREMERPVPKDILDEDDMDFAAGNESDVTKEDLEALGPKDLSMNMGEDENLLKNRVWPVDMAGEDLDVPGAELDYQNEAIGSEDEENNSYSLGGDRLEDNMEGK